jgi:hypothetical protein
MGENLFELIKGRNLVAYPDEEIRTAISRAVAVEGARGWKISKEKQSHRIDIVVALGMAALAAVRAQSVNVPLDYARAYGSGEPGEDPVSSWRRARTAAYLMSGGMVRLP